MACVVLSAVAGLLAGCNPYGMEYGVTCTPGGVEVEARNPTPEAWDWRADLDGVWHLARPGTTTVVRFPARPVRLTITTAGPSGRPDAVQAVATGC